MTIEKLHEALISKQLSSVEVTNYFLNRINAAKGLNAFIDVQPELSLEQAKQADQLIAQGNQGKLTGIPIAHKDVFVTKGWSGKTWVAWFRHGLSW